MWLTRIENEYRIVATAIESLIDTHES